MAKHSPDSNSSAEAVATSRPGDDDRTRVTLYASAQDIANAETLMIERLLSYDEVADLLGVTSRTVWTLVDKGEIRAVRFGNCVRIDPADLRAFIDRAKVGRR